MHELYSQSGTNTSQRWTSIGWFINNRYGSISNWYPWTREKQRKREEAHEAKCTRGEGEDNLRQDSGTPKEEVVVVGTSEEKRNNGWRAVPWCWVLITTVNSVASCQYLLAEEETPCLMKLKRYKKDLLLVPSSRFTTQYNSTRDMLGI